MDVHRQLLPELGRRTKAHKGGVANLTLATLVVSRIAAHGAPRGHEAALELGS